MFIQSLSSRMYIGATTLEHPVAFIKAECMHVVQFSDSTPTETQTYVHQNSRMLIALLIIFLELKTIQVSINSSAFYNIIFKNVNQLHKHDVE